MPNAENSKPQIPDGIEYKDNGKFLNIKMPVKDLRVIKMQKLKKPVIEIEDPVTGGSLVAVKWEKIGMLADFLGMPRNNLRNLVNLNDPSTADVINLEFQKQGDRLIQINCSFYNDTWYIFAFATDSHQVITFHSIRNEVKDVLGTDVIETTVDRIIVWEKQYRSFETEMDKFDVSVKVTSGRNTKQAAIKVMTLIRVASCQNSVICANFTAIKHTAKWRERLQLNLNSALEIAEVTQELVDAGSKKEITLEEGMQFIDNLQFALQNEDKIERVKEALKRRFTHEFKQNQNRFALSQAMSYVGTYEDPADTSAFTLETLQTQAYQVLVE